jgi:hypothetical protein
VNGPDHYQAAERLLETAREYRRQNGGPLAAAVAAEAQVHATLALAAATVDVGSQAATTGALNMAAGMGMDSSGLTKLLGDDAVVKVGERIRGWAQVTSS